MARYGNPMGKMLSLIFYILGTWAIANARNSDESVGCHAPNGCADVFVIGAGMSGAAAARELALHDGGAFSFLWAELGDDIGGRMQRSADKFGDIYVEDGAGWVQGAGPNPLHVLAKEYKIEFWQTQWDNYVFYEEINDGTGGVDIVSVAKRDTSFTEYYGALNCVAEEGFRRHKAVEDGLYEGDDMSVRDFLIQNCTPSWEPGYNDVGTSEAVDWAVEFYCLDFEYEFEPESISLNSFPTWIYGYDFQDKDLFISDELGYEEIAKRYSAVAGLPMFNTQVETVEWNHTLQQGRYRAKIFTRHQNGTKAEYWVRKVITTPAVGVYQNNPNMFYPLPTQKWDAMNRVFEMGLYYRMYFKFEEMFWDQKEFIFIARKDRINRGLCHLWQNLDYESAQRYTHGSKTLSCIITTENILRLKADYGNSLYHPGAVEEILLPLKRVYGENLPNYTFYYHDWGDDNSTYGSYENWKVGGTWNDFRTYSAPLSQTDGVNVVHWAGTATCRRHYHYTHGALYAGERAAKRVINELDPTANLDTTSTCDVEPGNGYCCPRPRIPRGL